MILQIVKELQAKNHFWYIDKCHNSVINNRNLPINNPKGDIVGVNAYAKFEWNPLTNTKVIERKRSADGRTDIHADGQRENIIPRH